MPGNAVGNWILSSIRRWTLAVFFLLCSCFHLVWSFTSVSYTLASTSFFISCSEKPSPLSCSLICCCSCFTSSFNISGPNISWYVLYRPLTSLEKFTLMETSMSSTSGLFSGCFPSIRKCLGFLNKDDQSCFFNSSSHLSSCSASTLNDRDGIMSLTIVTRVLSSDFQSELVTTDIADFLGKISSNCSFAPWLNSSSLFENSLTSCTTQLWSFMFSK